MKSCGSGPCRTCCAWDRKAEGITVDGPPTAPWGCGSQASPNLPIFSSGFIARPEEPTQTPFPSCARSRNTDLWRSNTTNRLQHSDCNKLLRSKQGSKYQTAFEITFPVQPDQCNKSRNRDHQLSPQKHKQQVIDVHNGGEIDCSHDMIV